jgi:hypothetical protein
MDGKDHEVASPKMRVSEAIRLLGEWWNKKYEPMVVGDSVVSQEVLIEFTPSGKLHTTLAHEHRGAPLPPNAISSLDVYAQFRADVVQTAIQVTDNGHTLADAYRTLGLHRPHTPSRIRIDPGVRFFMHMAKAVSHTGVEFKFYDMGKLPHISPPFCFEHVEGYPGYSEWKQASSDNWSVPPEVDIPRGFTPQGAVKIQCAMCRAFPDVQMECDCPACDSHMRIVERIGALTSEDAVLLALTHIKCTECGVSYSALHPLADVSYIGLKLRE